MLSTPYPPRRGQCPHAAGGANQGARLTLLEGSSSGSCPAGLGRHGSGPRPAAPGAAFPRQQGSGLRGQWGQDRAGQGRKESETLTTSSCGRAGRPRASRDRPQPIFLPPWLQKNVLPPRPSPEFQRIYLSRGKKMRGQAGWAPRALQRASPADDQGATPSRPRGNPPWLLGGEAWSPGTMSAGKAAVSQGLGSRGHLSLYLSAASSRVLKKLLPASENAAVTGAVGGDRAAGGCGGWRGRVPGAAVSLSLAGWAPSCQLPQRRHGTCPLLSNPAGRAERRPSQFRTHSPRERERDHRAYFCVCPITASPCRARLADRPLSSALRACSY